MRNPKVVIVGQGPRSFQHPEDAEVWVINGPRLPPRWDVLFQLHGPDHIEHKHGYDVEFMRLLGSIRPQRQRLLMTEAHGRFLSERLPIEVIKRQCGSYLTGSFAIAIAYATMCGFEEIILDGVMFAGGAAQWGAGEGWAVPCIEYHLGRAVGLGIRVTVPPGCGLFEHGHFVYGFEGPGSV